MNKDTSILKKKTHQERISKKEKQAIAIIKIRDIIFDIIKKSKTDEVPHSEIWESIAFSDSSAILDVANEIFNLIPKNVEEYDDATIKQAIATWIKTDPQIRKKDIDKMIRDQLGKDWLKEFLKSPRSVFDFCSLFEKNFKNIEIVIKNHGMVKLSNIIKISASTIAEVLAMIRVKSYANDKTKTPPSKDKKSPEQV